MQPLEHALLEAERPAVEGAGDSRRAEFATGRWLARQVLRELGQAPAAIAQGREREPRWPTGIVGSISHCGAACVAVLGSAARYRGLGIDLELNAVPPDLTDSILAPPEHPPRMALQLTFSAKEAVFKCLFPVTRTFLNFSDVAIEYDTVTGRYSARGVTRRVASEPLEAGRGCYARRDEASATLFWLPQPP